MASHLADFGLIIAQDTLVAYSVRALGCIALVVVEGAARLALEWRRCEPLVSPGPSV